MLGLRVPGTMLLDVISPPDSKLGALGIHAPFCRLLAHCRCLLAVQTAKAGFTTRAAAQAERVVKRLSILQRAMGGGFKVLSQYSMLTTELRSNLRFRIRH